MENTDSLLELCFDYIGKHAHQYYTVKDFAALPTEILSGLLYHIGPLALLLLEEELAAQKKSTNPENINYYLVVDHIWAEFVRRIWVNNYQRTSDIFHGLGENRCTKETYVDLLFKDFLKDVVSWVSKPGLYMSAKQLYPSYHLVPLAFHRKHNARYFVPVKPVSDFDEHFYASRVTTLVLGAVQVPFIVSNDRLLNALRGSAKILHIHNASDKYYADLRLLVVTLQYRGNLEDAVLFSPKLSKDYLGELMTILAGHADENAVQQILQDGSSNMETLPKLLLDPYVAGFEEDEDVIDAEDDSPVKLSEDDELYEYINNLQEDALTSRSKLKVGSPPCKTYVKLPEKSVGDNLLQKGLTGFAVIAETDITDSMESQLQTSLRTWPRLQKIVLCSVAFPKLHSILLELVKNNKMKVVIVKHACSIFDPHALLHDIVKCLDNKSADGRSGSLDILTFADITVLEQPFLDGSVQEVPVMQPVAFNKPFCAITELDFSFTDFWTDASCLGFVQYLKHDRHLRRLGIRGFNFSKHVGVTAALTGMKQLRFLCLRRSTGLSLRQLSELLQGMPQLAFLDVSYCALNRQTIDGETSIDAETFKAFTKIAICHPRLFDINLSSNRLGAYGNDFLEELEGASTKTLQYVRIGNNSLVPARTVALGRKVLRRIEEGRRGRFLTHLTLTVSDVPACHRRMFHSAVWKFVLTSREHSVVQQLHIDHVADM